MGRKVKGKIQTWIEYALFRLVAGSIRKLGLKTAYRLAGAASTLVYAFDAKHRRRAVSHLLHAGVARTPAEAEKLARANFRHLAKTFVEIIKHEQLYRHEKWDEHFIIKIEDGPALDALRDNPRQLIIATAHLGNWELAGNAYCACSKKRMTSIMRPLNNPLIGAYVYGNRTDTQHSTVSRELGVKPLLSALKNGDSIAIVCDQHASSAEGVVASLFGHPARTHATPALLHLKTGVPIFPCFVVRADDDFHFDVFSDGLIEYKPTGDKTADILAVTQRINDAIEKQVRRFPEQWIWPHRRWLDINRNPHPHHQQEGSPK